MHESINLKNELKYITSSTININSFIRQKAHLVIMKSLIEFGCLDASDIRSDWKNIIHLKIYFIMAMKLNFHNLSTTKKGNSTCIIITCQS